MIKPGLIAAGALGLLLLAGKKSSAATTTPGAWHAMPGVPPPTPPAPPITVPPNGRHLSPEEKSVLAQFIPQVDLDGAMLWWDTPASSFPSKDTVAVTTSRGIYLRGPNHAILSTFEFVTLGHELVHVGQQRRGEVAQGNTPDLELKAYQMGLGIERYMESFQDANGIPRGRAAYSS